MRSSVGSPGTEKGTVETPADWRAWRRGAARSGEAPVTRRARRPMEAAAAGARVRGSDLDGEGDGGNSGGLEGLAEGGGAVGRGSGDEEGAAAHGGGSGGDLAEGSLAESDAGGGGEYIG